jgi:hypothetical protein
MIFSIMMALRKAAVVCVVLMFLSAGLASMMCGEAEVSDETSARTAEGVTSGFRVGTPVEGSLKVHDQGNDQRSGCSVLRDRPVAVLVSSEGVGPPEPQGDPGTGWTYDVLISDQAWNQYNDGFQSMEVDPTNYNDIYVVYESWTSFATGADQWCLAVRRSTDGGGTWSPEIYVFYFPVTVNGVYPDMKEPDITIGFDGTIWITYTIFAYDGSSRNIIDMQVDAQSLVNTNWGGAWSSYMVTDYYSPYWNYHRLPSIAVHDTSHYPVIATMSYDEIAASYTSIVAWQPGPGGPSGPWDGWLVILPINANYVQYPCIDSGLGGWFYITCMYYYEPGGVFDMIVNRSTDGGMSWELVGDFYDDANVYSFYKPSIASTKLAGTDGEDYVMCAGTYTPDPSDMSLGQIGYAFTLDSGASWDDYLITMPNHQRMPYVQEDFDKTYFLMSYRQQDGGPAYSTRYMLAEMADLTTWYGPEIASDTGAVQASNWFAHVAVQRRPDGQDYPCLCWSDLRDAAAPITETSQTHVIYSTYGARWTIDTDPTGLEVMVDSQTYTAPQLFNWPAGYEHEIEVEEEQTGGGGEEYYFQEWDDGFEDSYRIELAEMDDTTLVAIFYELLQYSIPLHEGWNLVSLPFVQLDEYILQALAGISPDYGFVRAYDPTHPDKWLTFYEYRPASLNTLFYLDHTMGCWIYMDAANTLVVEGFDPGTTQIQLYAGWNLVGYPSLTPVSVGLALGGTGADAVEGYDGANPYHISPLPGSYMMQPGEGYWVHVPFDTTWTVDW